MPYQCLIVDDEPWAHQVIESYLLHLPDFVVVANCYTVAEALHVLHRQAVDLLFLDIKLPHVSGLSLLQSLPTRPPTILTTAFRDYAWQGFELDVCDYLLKPYSLERFLRALNKATAQLPPPGPGPRAPAPTEEATTLLVKADGKTHKLELPEILYVESLGSYVRIHLPQQRLVCLESMKSLERRLPAPRFTRIHRSYLVALAHIQSVDSRHVFIGPTALPVGESYKRNLAQWYSSHKRVAG
ncbi:LytR/AlgR family response regulator transcription factor [Hymenobacter terrenus]|uniref:LytR/AlgR family response regulator transcription factor n=1 Tax=Hymenobacter terrenus TaxID=1629124 RepID=UPI0006192966|nr:LytTR family DNA-binding domain-containing protein [Hymenobacter terrenus]